jgi:cytochrome c-type biogenesis protein CcmH/NrfF
MGILNALSFHSHIKRSNQNTTNDQDNNTTESNETRPTLWLEMPYIGTKGEQLLRALKRKLLRCLNITNVQIRTRVTTTKLNLFTNAKDKAPKQNKSNVVYQFTCPKCNNSYIGKTDRTLLERVKEHAYKDKESAVYKHLDCCYDKTFLTKQSNTQLTELVLSNTKIIDSS